LFGWCGRALRELSALAASSESSTLEITLRRFETRLLATLGYGLVLDHDVQSSTPVQAGQHYIYHLAHGPAVVDARVDQTLDDRYSESFGIPVTGHTLLAMQTDDFSDAVTRREAKHLLRAVLGVYLGSKPLASRSLMMQSAQLAQRVAQ